MCNNDWELLHFQERHLPFLPDLHRKAFSYLTRSSAVSCNFSYDSVSVLLTKDGVELYQIFCSKYMEWHFFGFLCGEFQVYLKCQFSLCFGNNLLFETYNFFMHCKPDFIIFGKWYFITYVSEEYWTIVFFSCNIGFLYRVYALFVK